MLFKRAFIFISEAPLILFKDNASRAKYKIKRGETHPDPPKGREKVMDMAFNGIACTPVYPYFRASGKDI